MAPLTDTRPKSLVEVAGKPLLDHAIDQCAGLNIVVNTHYFADQIERHIDGRNIALSDETDLLRETGGGLKHALPLLRSNPVFTMNTDAVWRGPNPIATLQTTWSDDMNALLLMIPRKDAVGHIGDGDFDIDANGRLTRGTGYVYSGLQIIRTDGLSKITDESFSMWSLWNDMLKDGTMYGVPYDGQWCDVGRPDSIAIAETMLESAQDV
ncbi:nucleotidyltransferase family protein [Octadecabacter sp. G9-8]|uniref:Nucleotidyltransferase family protein n=2 Tax=Octadecabacter dasysiphoniae TaxID=2909341 RepID=A0ABS9CYM8_9RHOB|nr:nucleotidyltransferase family protein [Octadecabacter dasysiphoniae]